MYTFINQAYDLIAWYIDSWTTSTSIILNGIDLNNNAFTIHPTWYEHASFNHLVVKIIKTWNTLVGSDWRRYFWRYCAVKSSLGTTSLQEKKSKTESLTNPDIPLIHERHQVTPCNLILP